MKKTKKILIHIVVLLVLVSIFSSYNVWAAEGGNFDFNSFESTDGADIGNVTNLVNDASANVITVARIACVTIAVVILLVISMKYMMSAPGDRADIKKHAVNYVIGAFVLFGVVGILSIIESFSKLIKV